MTLQEAETKTYNQAVEMMLGEKPVDDFLEKAHDPDFELAAIESACLWSRTAPLSEMIPMLTEGLATYEGGDGWQDNTARNILEMMREALFSYLYGFLWRELGYNPSSEG